MSHSATVYKVFIASPGDVMDERRIIREELARWNNTYSTQNGVVLLPVGWETHSAPEMGSHPQQIINETLLRDCDILIGVFWTKLGTPTERYTSGTVEEINEHIKSGKLTMIYFGNKLVRSNDINTEERDKVRQYAEDCKSSGLYSEFETLEEFRDRLRDHIQIHMTRTPFSEKPSIKKKDSEKLALITDSDILIDEIESHQVLVSRNLLQLIIHQEREEKVWDAIIRKLANNNCNMLKYSLLKLVEQKHETHYAFITGCSFLAQNSQEEFKKFLKKLFNINNELFIEIYEKNLLSDSEHKKQLDEYVRSLKESEF